MKDKTLIGMTSENELVFAEFELKDNNHSKNHFTASFDIVTPVIVTDEYLRERAEDLVESLDPESKWDIAERFNVAPSEIPDIILKHDGIEGVLDISLFPENFLIDLDGQDYDIYFESSSCGQHDIRQEGIEKYFVPKEFVEKLLWLWDNYHLKELDSKGLNEFYKLQNLLPEEGENIFIENWLKEYFLKEVV